MKTRRIAAAVLFTFLPAVVALPARAQDDAVTTQARARFKEGVEAFDKGRFEEARLSFLQAYALKKHPAVLLNLAQSSAKSGHPLEASKYFQQFLKEATTASPAQRKDAEIGLNDVRQKIGRIEVVAPPGTDVSMDDQGKVGTTPFDPIDVDVGQHTLKSSTQTVNVTAVAGQRVEARFGSSSTATPPPVVPVTPTPSEGATSPTASNPNNTTVSPDATHTKKSGLLTPPESMAPVYVGLVTAGIGLAGAIVFAAFKSDAQTKADKVAAAVRTAAGAYHVPTLGACNNPGAPQFAAACKTLKDNNSKVDTNATIANVSLVVMGVGLAVAGVWYLAGPKPDEPKTAASPTRQRKPQHPVLTPYAGWGNGGLSLAGEF